MTAPQPRLPKAGTVVRLGPRASVQFGGNRAILLRVITVDPRPTYYGWTWLSGYQLDQVGKAVAKREVFVLIEGIEYSLQK